jgi:hypothetical protein
VNGYNSQEEKDPGELPAPEDRQPQEKAMLGGKDALLCNIHQFAAACLWAPSATRDRWAMEGAPIGQRWLVGMFDDHPVNAFLAAHFRR